MFTLIAKSFRSSSLPSKSSKPQRIKLDRAAASVMEPLEDRRLMSTTIAFFDDPAYVNTAAGSDSNDLLAQIRSVTSNTVNTFTGTDAASFTSALSGANVLVIPALDQADLGASLNSSAINVIQNFVSSGGGLIITGDPSGHTESFLNDCFGFSTSYHYPDAPYPLVNDGSSTAFTGGPTSLAGNTNSPGLLVSGLPAGSENIYEGSGTYGTTVALLPYNSHSTICFLGWDWTNGGPGGTQDGGWDTVLQSAITQVGGGTTSNAGSIVVNSTSDTATGSGIVTLRDAIDTANSATSPTTITFDPTVFATAQTIVLDGTQLTLSNTAEPITITAPAAGVTISGDDQSRVLWVDANVAASLENVSITDGNTSASGGGIDNLGTLAITGGSINGNQSYYGGGGIQNCANLTMTDVTIASNIGNGHGGGFENYGAYSGDAVATLNDVAIFDNSTQSAGGAGIASDINGLSGSTTLVLNNVTVADNSSPYNGGGILLDSSNIGTEFNDVTIYGNTAGDNGGGVYDGAGTGATFGNTIIAGDSASSADAGPDVYGAVDSLGNNLIGATDGSSGWISSDLTGTAANPLGAGLGALANNGGPTETLLPQAGSFAIGHGSVSLIPSGVTTDQRGDPRTSNGAVDIGAVEVGGTVTPTIGTAPTVSTLTSTANIFPVGDYCYLTCTVASASGTGPVPTGTISIDQNGISKATETLVNGSVTFKWTALTAGPSALDNFVYSGDSTYASSTSNTIDQSYPALSQLTANITRAVIPSANVAGQPLNARVPASFTNTGPALSGTYTIVLYADTSTGGLSGNQVALETVTRHTTLRTNRKLAVTLTAKTLPANLTPGTYYLLVEITDPLGNANIVNTSQTIAVSAPFVAFTASSAAVKPETVAVNRDGSTVITVTNNGNISSTGVMNIALDLSHDGVTPAANFTTVTTTVRINIKPGKSSRFAVRFKIPAGLEAGVYYPLISVSADGVSASTVGSPFTAGTQRA